MLNKKIIIHDFCGHPFTYELACEFHKKKFDILYIFTKDDTGPKGDFVKKHCEYLSISNGYKIPKSNPLKRFIWEISYALKLKKELKIINPKYVLFANTPPIVLLINILFVKFKFIWWVQDIFSEAALKLKFLPKFARYPIYLFFKLIEFFLSLFANKIILISDDFKTHFSNKFNHKITTIENWPSKNNVRINIPVSRKKQIIYAGTIGFKHGKDSIVEVINKSVKNKFKFVLISEGKIADEITLLYDKEPLFERYSFMPYQDLVSFIADSSGALFVLDSNASKLSIPSKAYTYILANTPILGICDQSHHLSKLLKKYEIGFINDSDEFFHALNDENRFKCILKNLNKASISFDVSNKINQFLKVIES